MVLNPEILGETLIPQYVILSVLTGGESFWVAESHAYIKNSSIVDFS